jgi:hypothetical protein
MMQDIGFHSIPHPRLRDDQFRRHEGFHYRDGGVVRSVLDHVIAAVDQRL